MSAERTAAREEALKQHILSMPANLLRQYIVEHVDGASDQTIDQFVVLLRAQSVVPAKDITHAPA